MPPYRGCRYLGDSTAAKLSATGLNLPTSSLMTEDDVARVCDALKEAMS
jgi:dTDP-4-amino-4,6-dideoxygalactose transaminase